MRKSILIAMSFTLCTLVPAAMFAGGNPSSCGTDITNLTLNVYGTAANRSTSGYEIYSDAPSGEFGNYTSTKTNKVSLMFQINNCSYDFTGLLGGSSRKINAHVPARETTPEMNTTIPGFNFDRLGSVPITDDSNDFYTYWCNNPINPDGSFVYIDGKPLDNYLPCGHDLDGTPFARRSVGFGLANNYGLRFQEAPQALDKHIQLANGTCPIKVYHPNAQTWEIEPDNMTYIYDGVFPQPAQSLALGYMWSALINTPTHGAQSVAGYSIMPFKMVITRNP